MISKGAGPDCSSDPPAAGRPPPAGPTGGDCRSACADRARGQVSPAGQDALAAAAFASLVILLVVGFLMPMLVPAALIVAGVAYVCIKLGTYAYLLARYLFAKRSRD